MYFNTPVLKCFKLIKKINNKKSKKNPQKTKQKTKTHRKPFSGASTNKRLWVNWTIKTYSKDKSREIIKIYFELITPSAKKKQQETNQKKIKIYFFINLKRPGPSIPHLSS